eukprot:TRINITY_DN27989_c0_g2_i1.p1 TRINITY_DN27989_c0_g2~~TRINITY_DN27989_c0_g2_i1.p1  ORF type:complete len:242 (+),score=15.31 TRINITY_DN27989_c0_g2_i1:7-732(+)
MKRIYFLLIALLAFASQSSAQTDIQLTKTMSDTVKYANPAITGYIIRYTFKNAGPNSYDTSHRLKLNTFYGVSFTLRFPPASGSYPGGFPKDSSLVFLDTIGFTAVFSPNPKQLCDTVALVTGTGSPITDPMPTNNISCKSVFSKKDPLAIGTILATAEQLAIYPNPASAVVNVKYDFQSAANAGITVYDMAGKVVYKEQPKQVTAGEKIYTINTAQFNSGLYMIELSVNDSKLVSKFTVN